MKTVSQMVSRLIELNGGSAALAARQLGSSTASLSRYLSGDMKPRRAIEERLFSLVGGRTDNLESSIAHEPGRLGQLESAIAETLNALREEFHRSATTSKRQDVLDLVAVLVFAHVTSIDAGGPGIGNHLAGNHNSAAEGLNGFIRTALQRELADLNGHSVNLDHFFVPLTLADEGFAKALLAIFAKDTAFRSLHEAGRDDLVNEVFSRFMSASFVDEKEMGQYLTPSEVVRFMVEVGFHLMDPSTFAELTNPASSGKTVLLDPSCGVGSLLAEAVRYLHEKVRKAHPTEALSWLDDFTARRVVGIDKSERMLRLGCVNLGLFGATGTRLYLANGLARNGEDAEVTVPLEGQAQLILTNPPFGATYSGSDVAAFAMAQDRSRIDSEILFLERYVDWIAPGGIIVTIVPDSILVNRGAFAQLRALLLKTCQIEAVFSLPPVTFAAAGTSTKTSILVLRRQQSKSTHRTFFGVAREVGFDVVTRSGQRRRVHHARSDLAHLLTAFKAKKDTPLARWVAVSSETKRWDAGFHASPEPTGQTVAQGGIPLQVSDVAELVDLRQDPRRRKEADFAYIEISDIDGRTGLVGHKRLPVADAPSRARKIVREGDVLVSTVRPERGAIGVVPHDLDGAVCSTGFAVLRCREGMHPFTLAWLLKGEDVRRQMVKHNIGIAYPAISEETCLSLVLPVGRDGLDALNRNAAQLALTQAAFEAARIQMLRVTQEASKQN
jgi:type I restriction-modification system DNA methylase subunit